MFDPGHIAYAPILVTGLPRSGTSLTAGCLLRLGAFGGQTIGGDQNNPTGYFENVVLREQVVKVLLKGMGADPLGVHPLPELGRVHRIPGLGDAVLEEMVRQGYDGSGPWLYKGAKLTLLWPALADAFPRARWVVVRRDPDDVVASCLRTPFMRQHSDDPAFWREFVEQYRTRLTALADFGCWTREFWPADLIRGELGPLRELAGELGLAWDQEPVAELVNARHWHGSA